MQELGGAVVVEIEADCVGLQRQGDDNNSNYQEEGAAAAAAAAAADGLHGADTTLTITTSIYYYSSGPSWVLFEVCQDFLCTKTTSQCTIRRTDHKVPVV